MNAIKEALIAKLASDAELVTICGGTNVYPAYDDHEFDFETGAIEITVSHVSGKKDDRCSHREDIFQIRCSGRGISTTGSAADRIASLLEWPAVIPATGWRIDEISLDHDAGDDYDKASATHERVLQYVIASTPLA